MECFENQDHIGVLFKYIDNAIKNKINKSLAKFDITGVQSQVLMFLYFNEKKGHIFQKDIETNMKLTNPTVTGIVKRLEEKKMLTRFCSKDDARYKYLVLTEKGREVVKYSLNFGYHNIEKQLTKGFSPEEQEIFTILLKKTLRNIGE